MITLYARPHPPRILFEKLTRLERYLLGKAKRDLPPNEQGGQQSMDASAEPDDPSLNMHIDDEHTMFGTQRGDPAQPPSGLNGPLRMVYEMFYHLLQHQTNVLLARQPDPAAGSSDSRLTSSRDVQAMEEEESPSSNIPSPAQPRSCPGPRGDDNRLNVCDIANCFRMILPDFHFD